MSQPVTVMLSAAEPASGAGPARPAIRVLGVGSDPRSFRELARVVENEGGAFERAPTQAAAIRLLAEDAGWDVVAPVLADEADAELSAWAETLARLSSRPRLIALASAPSVGLALRVSRLCAGELLAIPVDRERARLLLRRLMSAADERPVALPEVSPEMAGTHQMVAQSPAMLAVAATIARVAPSTATVLILGASGTGKELVARAIHQNGPRATGPFVPVNCAAIPENLLESELFGHEKGSFTGAVARRIGRFERAAGGTLFLDEIGDMSLVLQSKILRAVQEREIERVGDQELIPVDVRLIAATHHDLREAIAQGRFREDLYYRLAVVTLRLPPLSERGNDLVLLVAHFIREFGERYGRPVRGITDRALERLQRHDWLGNVRELRSVIERAVLITTDDTLRSEHLPDEWGDREAAGSGEAGPTATLEAVEARHISRVLAQTGGEIAEAARILGVHRNTLARKIREYRL
jgi:DNA-binding NtrC family response regulator